MHLKVSQTYQPLNFLTYFLHLYIELVHTYLHSLFFTTPVITRFEIFDGEVMREISICFLRFFLNACKITKFQLVVFIEYIDEKKVPAVQFDKICHFFFTKFKLFLIDYIEEKVKFHLLNEIKSVTFEYDIGDLFVSCQKRIYYFNLRLMAVNTNLRFSP